MKEKKKKKSLPSEQKIEKGGWEVHRPSQNKVGFETGITSVFFMDQKHRGPHQGQGPPEQETGLIKDKGCTRETDGENE